MSLDYIFKFDELMIKAEEYELAQLAPNTRLTYISFYKLFARWCQQNHREAMPTTATDISHYIASIGDKVSKSTIEITIAAIEYFHRQEKLTIAGDLTSYHKVKRGIFRAHPRVKRQVKAIKIDDLKAVCRRLNRLNAMDCRDLAILTLGYFAGLRRSEICALNREDIVFTDQGMMVTIMRSKTSKVPIQIPIAKIYDPSICPVIAMIEHLRNMDTNPIPNERALFITRWEKRMKYGAIVEIIKGHYGPEYSGHSLRRGLITSLAEKGVHMNDIKKISRHKSLDMVSEYIEVVEGYQKSSGVLMGA